MQQIILTSFNCITKSLKIELHKYLPSYPGKRKVHSIFPHNMTDIQNRIWRREIVIHRFTDFSKILHSVSKNLRIFFMYFRMHFFICMFCACVFRVIFMQYGGFTRKKHACLLPHFLVIDVEDFILAQKKINIQSYWRKKSYLIYKYMYFQSSRQ